MIEGMLRVPVISLEIARSIIGLSPLRAGDWDRSTKIILAFKKEIRSELKSIQNNKCVYCSEMLDVSSRGEIEHIAPKGGKKLPKHYEFSFTIKNLVLACNKCNAGLKGRFDPIETKSSDYEKCTFSIVHPYFDDHSQCYSWNGPVIIFKNAKGKNSIKLFDLNSNERTLSRAKELFVEHNVGKDPGLSELLKALGAYKPSVSD